MNNEKTTFSIKDPSPKWATWLFRIVFLLTSVAVFLVANEPSVPDTLKVRIAVWLKALDVFVWGIGRGLGVKKSDFENEQNN